jgi:hypothetical protein
MAPARAPKTWFSVQDVIRWYVHEEACQGPSRFSARSPHNHLPPQYEVSALRRKVCIRCWSIPNDYPPNRSGAVGINLTQANRVFLMEPCFNPALEAQVRPRSFFFCLFVFRYKDFLTHKFVSSVVAGDWKSPSFGAEAQC